MPAYTPCAITFCDRPVTKLGDVCDECKEREKKNETDWRWRGWTRRDNNRDVRQGHKERKEK